MAPTDQMKKAEQTYSNFTGTLKWVVPLIAAVVLLVILLIA